MPFLLPPIIHCGIYQPYKKQGMKNPNCDKLTYTMMDFKNPKHSKHKAAIKTLSDMVIQVLSNRIWKNTGKCLLDEEYVVIVAPSHQKNTISSGLESIAFNLCLAKPMGTYHPLLIRHTTVESAKYGGERSEDIHKNSIIIKNPHLIKDKIVFVLDDVTTTGCTLRACGRIIAPHGPKHIELVSILKTA